MRVQSLNQCVDKAEGVTGERSSMSCAAGVVYQNSKFVSQANCSQLQSAASANQFMDEGHKPLYFKDFGITWDYFSITFQKKKVNG